MTVSNLSSRLRQAALFTLASSLTLSHGLLDARAQSDDFEYPSGFVRKAVELLRLRHYVREIEDRNRAATARLPEHRKHLDALKEREANLRGQIEEMLNPDNIAFQDLEVRAKAARESGDPDEKLAVAKTAEAFLRDYPLSSKLAEAQKMQRSMETAAATDAQRQEEAYQAKLADRKAKSKAAWEKFVRGDMKVLEVRDYLRTRDKEEIIKMIGRPDAQRSGGRWAYRRALVTDDFGKKRGIVLTFEGGRVLSVSYY